MSDSPRETLERIARRVPVPQPAYDRLMRRRERKERNRRISATALVIVIMLGLAVGFARSFDSPEPANPPPSAQDRFARIGGWLTYNHDGVVSAMDPAHPRTTARLSSKDGTPLGWSAAGSALLLLDRSGQALSVLYGDGTRKRAIDVKGGQLLSGGAISPDGTQVVYATLASDSSDSSIFVVGLDGGAPRKILGATPRSYTGGFPTEFAWPAFSPDGTRIAYFDGMGDHDNTLRVMNIDGTGGRVVLKDVGMMPNSAGLRHLAWSPDGTRLLFQMGYGPYQIYTVNADGSGLTKVAQGTHPAWSPDGTRISYTLAGALGGEGTEGRHHDRGRRRVERS